MSAHRAVLLKDLLVTTKDGDWGKGDPTPDHLEYRVIRGTDFARARFGDLKAIPTRYLPERSVHRRTLQAGDILIETAGGTSDRPTGRTLLVTQELLDALGAPATCASFARFMRVKAELANPAYIYWYLQNMHARGEMSQHEVRHTGVGRFQYTKFAETQEIPLPPLEEQRAIAATLGALDDKIDSNRRAIATAERLGDALFVAVSSELRPLADVAETITMGSSPKGADLNEDGDGLPFYQGTRDFGARFPSLRVWTTAPTRIAVRNDTLMSVRAPVGELNRASTDCCIGRGVAAIHNNNTPSALYYAMRNSSSAWSKFQGEGTVFASVNKADVHATEIYWVEDDALVALEGKLAAIDARIESLEKKSRLLVDLRETLLPELLSGRAHVPIEGAVTRWE